MTAALCLISVAVATPFVSRRLAGDPVSPPAIAIAVWCGTLGLFELHLQPYRPLAVSTWMIIWASLAVLVGGLVAGTWVTPRGERPAIAAATLARARIWVPLYALLGLAGTGWYLWRVRSILGWDALSDGARIREALGNYTIPSGFLFLQFFCVATPLVALTIRLLGQRLRSVDVVAAVACTLATWLSTDRTEFFTLALVSTFLVLYLKGPRLSVGQLVSGPAIAVAALALNFLVIGRWVHKASEASAYFYATASYPALDLALQAPPAGTRGLHTFYPLARLLERVHLLGGPLPSPIFPFVDVTHGRPDSEWGFNGYTWLNYPYQDWGLPGLFLYVAVVGAGCGVLYGFLRRNRARPALLLITAQLATGLVLTPFVNKFNNTASWYVAVATIAPFVAAGWYGRRPQA